MDLYSSEEELPVLVWMAEVWVQMTMILQTEAAVGMRVVVVEVVVVFSEAVVEAPDL